MKPESNLLDYSLWGKGSQHHGTRLQRLVLFGDVTRLIRATTHLAPAVVLRIMHRRRRGPERERAHLHHHGTAMNRRMIASSTMNLAIHFGKIGQGG
jgi:hypothetical protein